MIRKMYKNVLNNVQERRIAAGLTQKQLAEKAQLGIQTIVNIENGMNTRKSTLERIAEVFNVSIEQLNK